MLQDPNSIPTERRKSMDPVSQHIHLDDLPSPGTRYEIQELIGIGTCAKVYSALDKETGNKVAVKIVENIAENLLEIESEHRVLSAIGGQALIPEFYGTYLHSPKNSERQLWFVMELCEGVPVSDLLTWLKNEGLFLKEEEIAALLKFFMMVVQHLHENDIIYRDVKSSNFILSPDGTIKLVDYGSCALVKETEGKTHSSVGSPHWMAPEVISCEQLQPYTKSCDVWSLGITAIELAEAQPPLFEIHPVRSMFQIARNPPPMLKKAAEWSEHFKDFISECLVRNPEHRPCIVELMLHPFITEIDDVTKQPLTLEEHLQQPFVPNIGEKVKQILERLGDVVKEKLYPIIPSDPVTMTVKNWYFKNSPDAPYVKILPDDLAATENPSEDYVMEHLYRRYLQDEIYSYIGDVLIAINPGKKLPLYDAKVQVNYWEKARSDNPPHVFAVADRAYQQMLHHKRSQVIITFGKSGSGKSFSATQIINQLAFLSPTGNVGMTEKIQQLCPLLEAFGCSRTSSNRNASQFLKTVSVTFTKTGKVTGAIIFANLLDRTRISTTPENECNFHILYCMYEGLKSEKRLTEFGLDKLSSCRYMPQKNLKNTAELVAGYKAVCHAFRTLAFTDEEILVILRILSAILLLGDVTYTIKGASPVANNPYLIASAAKNLSIDNERLQGVICRGPCVEDVERKRDAWVQFLYIRTFDWIVASINKQLSFSRLVLGDSFSVSVMDPPGFETNEHNQLFRLSANVIDDFLQNYIQQLMFFKEVEEYKEEGVDIPFRYEGSLEQKQSLNDLVDGEKRIFQALHNADIKGTFDWSDEISVLSGNEFFEITSENLTVQHVLEKVSYVVQDLTLSTANDDEVNFIETFQATNDAFTAAIANSMSDASKCQPEQMLDLLSQMLNVMTEDFPHLVVCLQPSQTVLV